MIQAQIMDLLLALLENADDGEWQALIDEARTTVKTCIPMRI